MKAIYQTVSRRSKKKNQPRTFDGNGITVRTLHKSEKALLIILSEIDGDDSETKEPDISEEEIDEVEELQGSGNLPPADIRMLSKNLASQRLGWPKAISKLAFYFFTFRRFSAFSGFHKSQKLKSEKANYWSKSSQMTSPTEIHGNGELLM